MILLKSLLYFLIIPSILGVGILQFSKKEKDNILLGIVIGYIYSFVVYEFLAIPMIFIKANFTTLTGVWQVAMLISTIIAAFISSKNFFKIIKNNKKRFIDAPKKILLLAIILVAIQAFIGFVYMHEDYDDSNFVAKATIAFDTNTLYKFDDKGVEYETLPSRHVLSPFPIFTATTAKILGTHPAIVAHTIFPPVFIILAYIIYFLIGDALFKDDKKMKYVFLILLSVLYIFGAYSEWSNFVFLLYRVWQGKALIANVFIPFIWLLFLKYIHNDDFYWIILFITLWAADLTSSMGLFIPTLTASALCLLYSITQKNKKYILNTLICFLPSLVYGIIFLIIK